MRSYHIDAGQYVLREHPEPVATGTQVVVRVHATSLNKRDTLILDGQYPMPARDDVIPLSDGAGEVVAVGDGVRAWAAGDRVAATYFPAWLSGPGTPEKTEDDLGERLVS